MLIPKSFKNKTYNRIRYKNKDNIKRLIKEMRKNRKLNILNDIKEKHYLQLLKMKK